MFSIVSFATILGDVFVCFLVRKICDKVLFANSIVHQICILILCFCLWRDEGNNFTMNFSSFINAIRYASVCLQINTVIRLRDRREKCAVFLRCVGCIDIDQIHSRTAWRIYFETRTTSHYHRHHWKWPLECANGESEEGREWERESERLGTHTHNNTEHASGRLAARQPHRITGQNNRKGHSRTVRERRQTTISLPACQHEHTKYVQLFPTPISLYKIERFGRKQNQHCKVKRRNQHRLRSQLL